MPCIDVVPGKRQNVKTAPAAKATVMISPGKLTYDRTKREAVRATADERNAREATIFVIVYTFLVKLQAKHITSSTTDRMAVRNGAASP